MEKNVVKKKKRKIGKPDGSKSTDVEVFKRQIEIEKLLVSGIASHIILQNIMEKYVISQSQVEKDIHKIKLRWKRRFEAESDTRLMESIKMREDWRSRALGKSDFDLARKMQNDIDKLLGLFVEKVERLEMTYAEWRKKQEEDDDNSKSEK